MADNNNNRIAIGENYKNTRSDFKIDRMVAKCLAPIVMNLLKAPISGLFIIGMLILKKYPPPNWIALFLISLPFFFYLNKDFFNVKSLAKRVLGFQLIDRKIKNLQTNYTVL